MSYRSGDRCPSCSDVPDELRELAGQLKTYTPRTTGFVYFLVHCGVVVYVGKAVELETRMKDHRVGHTYSRIVGKKEFDSSFYIEAPICDLERIEREWIVRLKPKYNLKHSGRGYGKYNAIQTWNP